MNWRILWALVVLVAIIGIFTPSPDDFIDYGTPVIELIVAIIGLKLGRFI